MTIVSTINSASTPITNNLLDAREIFPILEEATAERTSDIALGTLQSASSELSKELKELRKQFATELNQLSLKLSLILKNQDRLSKELEELRKQPIISLCPPPPPPLPLPKISLKDQENSKKINPSLPTLSTGNLCRSQSLRIKTSKEPIATEEQIAKGLKNLRRSKNDNETNLLLQTTAPALETKPSPLKIKSLPQNQSIHVEDKQGEDDKKPETEKTMTFAEKLAQFKNLS